MKRLVLLVSILVSSALAKADAGNCVRYHVSINFSGGAELSGHLFLLSYNPALTTVEQELTSLLKSRQHPHFVIYEEIHSIELLDELVHEEDKWTLRFNACSEDRVHPFSMDTVKNIRIWSFDVCKNNLSSANYMWDGIIPVVVSELNHSELKALTTIPQPSILIDFGMNDFWDSYRLVTLETNVERSSMDSIIDQFRTAMHKLVQNGDWNRLDSEYNSYKEKLRKLQVVLIKFSHGC